MSGPTRQPRVDVRSTLEKIVLSTDVRSDRSLEYCPDNTRLTDIWDLALVETMSALMEMVTKFCFGEDAWFTKQKAHDTDLDKSGMKDEYNKPKHNRKNKCRDNEDDDDQISASFEARRTAVWDLMIFYRPCDYHKP